MWILKWSYEVHTSVLYTVCTSLVSQDAHFTTFLLCRAPVDDVVAWGESLDHLLECKSKLLAPGSTPLTLLSDAALSIHPPFSLSTLAIVCCSGPAYRLELPSGFFRRIEDIFFPQVHQIHLEIYLRRMTLAEIRGLIWAASVDGVITARSPSFIKPALTDGFSPDHIPGLYLKMTKGGRWVLSLSLFPPSSLITLLKWIQPICNISACCLLRQD